MVNASQASSNARVWSLLRADIARWEEAWDKRFSAGLILRLVLLEGGFQFVMWLRFIQALGRVPILGKAIATVIRYWLNIVFACDIGRRIQFGPGLFVPHPNGIVIGADTVIGADVTICHQVTLGRGRAHAHTAPRLEDETYIAPGAKVLGDIVIGKGALIGANSVVTRDVPAYATALGNPARLKLAESARP